MNQPARPTANPNANPGTPQLNDNLVLIVGKSATGKSASLRDLADPTEVIHLNCEAGQKLPFPSRFKTLVVTDPHQIPQAFTEAENMPDVHTIVVDSLTYLMDMYETMYIYPLPSSKTMKAWNDYAQYFRSVMQGSVARSSKNVIFTAHTRDKLNETEMVMETLVPIKGATQNNGVESYFSCVIAAKKVSLRTLDGYESPLLVITPEEEALGFKYVFQTRLTKDTVNERIRSPMGLWEIPETFIDNNAQHVLDRLKQYYGH